MMHLKDIDNQLELLEKHRQTLSHYLGQRALLGRAFTPPGVTHGINEARENIRRIKTILREWDIPVEDQPDDGSDLFLKKTSRKPIKTTIIVAVTILVSLPILYIAAVRFQESDKILNSTQVSPTINSQFPYTSIYGPSSKSPLQHEKLNTTIFSCSGVSIKNFITEVKFYNPHDQHVNSWDYGVSFRLSTGSQYRFTISSSKRVGFGLIQGGKGDVKFETYDNAIDNLPAGSNTIRIQADNQRAIISVNGKYVDEVDVSEIQQSGDICVGAGFLPGNSIAGQTTNFENFVIYQLPE